MQEVRYRGLYEQSRSSELTASLQEHQASAEWKAEILREKRENGVNIERDLHFTGRSATQFAPRSVGRDNKERGIISNHPCEGSQEKKFHDTNSEHQQEAVIADELHAIVRLTEMQEERCRGLHNNPEVMSMTASSQEHQASAEREFFIYKEKWCHSEILCLNNRELQTLRLLPISSVLHFQREAIRI